VRLSFWVAGLSALLVTGALCFSFVQRVQQADDLIHIAERSADQVERLNHRLDDADNDRAELMQQNRQLARALRRQNHYLRQHGIEIPPTVIKPSRLEVTRPKASGTSDMQPTHSPPSSPSQSPTTGPTDTDTPRPSTSPAGLTGVIEPLCDLLSLPTCLP